MLRLPTGAFEPTDFDPVWMQIQRQAKPVGMDVVREPYLTPSRLITRSRLLVVRPKVALEANDGLDPAGEQPELGEIGELFLRTGSQLDLQDRHVPGPESITSPVPN
jgi:hypothetical protein